MKYYFILTDSRDAWMQFVYLPTGDYVSGYTVTCGVWEYPYMTMTFGRRKHDPLPSGHWNI